MILDINYKENNICQIYIFNSYNTQKNNKIMIYKT